MRRPPCAKSVAAAAGAHALTLLVGGNNAVTRPAVLALGADLENVGLITLDAHFDMRDLDQGLGNGNPVRALIQEAPRCQYRAGGPCSVREQPSDARGGAGGRQPRHYQRGRRNSGIAHAIERALDHVSHCDALVIDCDIDVIDRSQFPAAPGARPGGMRVDDFFYAVRRLASNSRVRVIDLVEWDPPLDATDLSALTAARWVAECLAGYEMR